MSSDMRSNLIPITGDSWSNEPTERRLEATYANAGIGIAEVDTEGLLLRVNAHLAELLGSTPEELLGRSIFDPDLTDDAASDEAQFRQQVAGEIEGYTVEKRFRRPDGSRLWISVRSSTIRNAQGQFLYAVRIQQDITAQRLAEEALARRAEEQAALYEFTEGLQRASTTERICALALTAIRRALRCDRASVLLFDTSGIMRFASSMGLSNTYRNSVEGHSPWSRSTTDARPICVDDMEASDLSDELKAAIRKEGIGALVFVPIMARGRVIGKFMTYYDQRHVFTDGEIACALMLARQLGFALKRIEAEAERQQTERAAQQLAAIVESSSDAIVSKDLNGIVATWNKGAEALFGYRAAEVIGRPITVLIPADRLSEEPAILARICRGERVEHLETVRRRKDGTSIDVSLTISPVRDQAGTVVGASKIARDISDRKQTEAALRDSEKRLQDLLAAIPAAIYTTDAQGKITYYNQTAVELAGRAPRLGTDEWCVTWKLYRPDGTPLPHEECPMAVALKEGRAIRNEEAVAERPDGTRVPFIPYPTPLRNSNGEIVGAINMLVDVGERKHAEYQQRVLFDELNHRVKNNMQMLQSLLQISAKKTTDPQPREILREAGRRVAAMAAAQQVLYGTKDATSFSAKQFLTAVSQMAQQALADDITVFSDSDEFDLANDAAMPLALIINELITNAAKHGPKHTGLSVVRVMLSRDDGGCTLCVEDEGKGFRLADVRPRSSGLSLVQGLARQLAGSFDVKAYPNTQCLVRFGHGSNQ